MAIGLGGLAQAEQDAGLAANAERGAAIYPRCVGCHQIGAGAFNRIGPHLNGVFGRAAAGLEGFVYSDALMSAGEAGMVWDMDSLDAYITDPNSFVAGTKMVFAGLESAQDRADLLAYLHRYSEAEEDIPLATHRAEVDLAPEILALAGDPAYGQYLASECSGCHQSGAGQGIPTITGWAQRDFVIAMHAYKQKVRPNPVMQVLAGRLSDEEIAALAAYYESVE